METLLSVCTTRQRIGRRCVSITYRKEVHVYHIDTTTARSVVNSMRTVWSDKERNIHILVGLQQSMQMHYHTTYIHIYHAIIYTCVDHVHCCLFQFVWLCGWCACLGLTPVSCYCQRESRSIRNSIRFEVALIVHTKKLTREYCWLPTWMATYWSYFAVWHQQRASLAKLRKRASIW